MWQNAIGKAFVKKGKMMAGFRERLEERQKKVNSLVCVGLDPLEEKLPQHLRGQTSFLAMDIGEWMKEIVQATAEFACMFKPQSAHWEALYGGVGELQRLIAFIKLNYPDIPVFLDCKRGDISRTQQQYRVAHLNIQGADGMNFSPYMGKDCMSALVDKDNMGKALVGLCFTSNPSAREIQNVQLADGLFFWEYIALCIEKWAEELGVLEDAGLVMAAAYKDKGNDFINASHLARGRGLVGDDLWFLIPGIGTQGGLVEETIGAAYLGPGSIAINSSSEICFAGSGTDFAKASAKKAKELRDSINTFVQW